jgi:hypothetical protein
MRSPMRYRYEPTPSLFVPGLRPGDIVTDDGDTLADHPCFSPVPEAEPTPEDAPAAPSKRTRRT